MINISMLLTANVAEGCLTETLASNIMSHDVGLVHAVSVNTLDLHFLLLVFD